VQSIPGEIAESLEPQTPSTAGMTSRVMKGSLWTLGGQVAPLLFSFVATPFVIRLLGAEGYGVFILIGLIPSYFNFADLGMGMASTKFGSEAYADGDRGREARIVRTSAVLALMMSVPIALLIATFSGRMAWLFNVPPEFQGQAVLALKIAAATFVLNFLNSIFNTPQLTRLRMDLNTLVSSVPRILGVVFVPVVVYFGGGIVGAVTVLFAASLLTLIANLYFSRALLPDLAGISIERPAIRPLLKFGGALVFASVAAVFLVNVEKLILVRVTSVETLAHYSVAYTLANMVTLFTVAMAQSLVPAFSQLAKPDKRDQLDRLYVRSLRINIFSLLPCLVVLAVVAKPFFTVWAGPEFGLESPLPFYILEAGLFFNLNACIPWAIILSQGRTDIFAKLYWIQILPYIALTALLTYRFGAPGAAAAWSARVILESYIFFRYAGRIGGVYFSLSNYIGPLLVGLVVLLPPLVLAAVNNLSSWLLIATPVSLSFYSVLIWRLIVEPEEKVWVAHRTNNLYNRILRFV
jgi:O-antigen/teichoic acid export membrane protein